MATLNPDRLETIVNGWLTVFLHLALEAADEADARAKLKATLTSAITQALLEADPNGQAMSRGLGDVAKERRRQIETLGYGAEHDNEHDPGELAAAGSAYALHAASVLCPHDGLGIEGLPLSWPWHPGYWKPRSPRRDLVRAAALIVAELDRIDRMPRSTSADLEHGEALIGEGG